MSLRVRFAIEIILLEAFSVSLYESPNGLLSQFSSIRFNKFLAKILLPVLFR